MQKTMHIGHTLRGAVLTGITGILLAGCATAPERELRAWHDTHAELHAGGDQGQPALATRKAPVTLADCQQYALAHNPRLRAAFERGRAALEQIPPARTLDDPVLSFEYFIEQMDTRYQVSLTQVFPVFGKLGLREKHARALAMAARHVFETERLALCDQVSKAFYEYHYLARTIQVTDEHRQIIADLEQVVTARYQAGLAPFSVLIKTQVEQDRVANQLATLRDERASRSAALAALLNLPAHDLLPWPKPAPARAAVMDLETLTAMFDELNPEIQAVTSLITAETHRGELARKSLLPDLMLGASWMVMPGMAGQSDESDVGLMAGITLPLWWGKYRAEIRAADAMVRATSNDRIDRQNMLRAELNLAIFKFHDAERRMDLFDSSLLPKASQALAVARQEFSSGKSDFMTLIDAQRTWLEFRLMSERARADREIALGAIGRYVGEYNIGVAQPPGTINKNTD